MADILRIFKRDMCGIFRNVLVLIIVSAAGAVCMV